MELERQEKETQHPISNFAETLAERRIEVDEAGDPDVYVDKAAQPSARSPVIDPRIFEFALLYKF